MVCEAFGEGITWKGGIERVLKAVVRIFLVIESVQRVDAGGGERFGIAFFCAFVMFDLDAEG